MTIAASNTKSNEAAESRRPVMPQTVKENGTVYINLNEIYSAAANVSQSLYVCMLLWHTYAYSFV